MKLLQVKQGTPEWEAARAGRFTASEAPAMMGDSRHTTRDELLRQKATGIAPEVTPQQQALFDKGHAAEAAARAIIEQDYGLELYPATALHDEDDMLLASFDGVDMFGTTIWEHKLWNEQLAEAISNGDPLDAHYYWQLEHQLLVSGADYVLFTVSDGTRQKMVTTEYRSRPERLKALVAGWRQFREDLERYQPQEPVVEAVAEPIDRLPTLVVQITGGVTRSNLADYEKFALDFIRNINTDLQTDEDFANAEAAVKFCASTEKELDAVKQAALDQTADIADLFKAIDNIRSEMRAKRLHLDKLVKARKQAIRAEIVHDANAAFAEHISTLEERLNHVVRMPEIPVDFAGAVKNKRTVESLRNAVNTELARAKIAANEVADRIEINIKAMLEHAPEHRFLFTDLQQTCTKEPEDFVAMVKLRVAEHKEAELRRLEAERERIRKEEQAKAETESGAEEELRRQQPEQPETPPQTAAKPQTAQANPPRNISRVADQLRMVLNEIHNYTAEGLRKTLYRIADGVES